MITFEDFAPRVTSPAGPFRRGQFQTFEDAVKAADAWIRESGVDVINLETVVLPNVWSPGEEGTVDAELPTNEGNLITNNWYQFVRVWYRRPDDNA